MLKDKNIVLIGMPGVGKSTAGVVLAKVLGYNFIDSDLLIQAREKRLLKDIIARDGQEGFIKIENEVNADIDVQGAVIATGGSVIYGKEAMEHLKSIGVVVYLKASYEEIESRLGNLSGRGVVMKKGQALRDVYDEREPMYARYADIIIEEKGQSIRETVKEITEKIEKNFTKM